MIIEIHMELDASILVPVHNEASVLRENALKLREYLMKVLPNHEIIFCENGSTDETAHITKELANDFDDIEFLSLPEPNLAEALREGIKAARSEKVVYYPIDLSVGLGFIPESVSLLDKFDVVIGSKRLGAGLDGRSLARKIPSGAYHGMVRRLYGVEFTDTTCVKAFRRSRILKIIERVPTASRIYETELLVEAQREGLNMIEVPVSVEEHRPSREGLTKKIQRKTEDLLSARLDLISMYVGAVMFLVGMVVLAYLTIDKLLFASQGGFLNPYSFLISMLLVISGFQIATFGLLANLILQIRRELAQALGRKNSGVE